MKCRNCNNEVSEKDKNCPYCNTPLHKNDTNDGPTLGFGMVTFIILGTIFLVAFGFIYYAQHKNDPEYTQTAIEPDSNLAETNKAKFDTVAIDTAKTNSTDKLEEQQAEKVYNSIRGRSQVRHNRSHSEASSSTNEGSNEPETPSNSPSPTPPPAPTKPHVESIEME